jgi:hypothetical protein
MLVLKWFGVKVKLSHYRPGQTLGVSRRLRLQNFYKIGT